MAFSMKLVREGNRELFAIFGVMEVSVMNPLFEHIRTTIDVKHDSHTGRCHLTVWITEEGFHHPRAVNLTFDTRRDAKVLNSIIGGTDIILVASPNPDELTDTNVNVAAWSAIDGGYVYVHLKESERQLLQTCLS